MTRMSTVVAGLVSALLAGSLVWGGQPVAQADDLSDAKAKLTDLQGQASKADEEYNQVNAKLKAAEAVQAQDEADIANQQSAVAALRDRVAVVSLQQFQDRGMSQAVLLLTSENQDEMLTTFMVSSMVSDTTTALLQSYRLSQATLSDMLRRQEATVEAIKADRQKMSDLKAEASTKVKEAQALVDKLTAEEQARIAAANAAALAASRAGGGGTSAHYSPPPPVANGAAAQAIVDWAMARVGLPYVYGGAGPNSYDCSGFTMMAYASVGISLPHGSMSQFNYGREVAKADVQPGDLVFFYDGPGHVGIYVGGGMIVDARNESVGVVYGPLNGFMPFVGARRLL